MIAIGIDTGSTSTDAVVYDLNRREILAFAKSITTHDNLASGIRMSLKKLPENLVSKAAFLSLSTTLATNACVENKGANVCLLFIGVNRNAVEWTLASYGFESMDFMRFIEGNASAGTEPDWDALDRMLPEITQAYDAVAVAQMAARDNDGLYEKQAAERIRRFADIPVTCSYEIFRELNVIKRGAGALLNARIAPEIKAFFDAIHQVLEEERLELPVYIMRSDGSLVSENYTMQYPVETLVCGPTASAKGAMELFRQQQAIVVDMGGTTSDMAILRNGQLKIDDEGICLAGWQTFVRGISIETVGLGGDSHVCYKNRNIFLDSRRVMPISILAGRFPEIIPELESLTEYPHGSFVPLYEHFILMHKPGSANTEHMAMCEALEEKPLSITALAKAVGTNEYHVSTEDLEQKGNILRCGFTPTDAILLKGDRKDASMGAYGELMNTEAACKGAQLALQFIANSTGRDPDWILEEIYRQVKETLYCQIIRLLWRDSRQDRRITQPPAQLTEMAKDAFRREMEAMGKETDTPCFYRNTFSTDAVLLGIGAPVHIFLPDVAAALHTSWKVSEYSSVTNALGAMLGDVCVYETVSVRADYVDPKADVGTGPFIVYGNCREAFEKLEEATDRAAQIARERAFAQAGKCGARQIFDVTCEIRIREGQASFSTVSMGADVTACARGTL